MEKLKVILIDDETLIRKLIRMKIDWEALGMEIIAEFSSSRKALDEVEKLQPDIIITDICMPGMDGIEFSEECISIMPQVKIMILTGHDEFNYAKKSVHIGVSDYILKPINGEEITKSLREMSSKIYEEQSKNKKYEELSLQIEENRPIYYEAYINQILQQPQPDETFLKKMAYFHVAMNPDSSKVQAAVLEIAMPFKLMEQGEENNELILYLKARQLTEEFFSRDSYLLICRDGLGRIVILSNNPKVSFLECLDLLRKMLITRLRCYVTIGVGLVKEDYSQIASTYKEATQALNYKVVDGTNCIICYEEIGKSKEGISADEEEIWNETKIYIRAGVPDKAANCIQSLWQFYKQGAAEHNHKARNMFVNICSWCFNEAVRQELPDKMFFQKQSEKVSMNAYSVKAYEEETLLCVTTLAKAMAIRDEKKSDSLIHEILLYMSQNLGDPQLSMNKVAEHAFISTGYLGRILKKYTGKTYGEYLSELRFNKVKELLKETDLKGYEMGEKIGILDAHYLSIWFKKMSGYSLSDYRKIANKKKS